MSQIKKLREITGAGMMECKNAIDACNLGPNDDLEPAIKYLREKGLASMIKRSGNLTNNGNFGLFEDENSICIIELLSETDFVANSEAFQTAANHIAQHIALNNINVEDKSLQDVAPQNVVDTLMSLKENIKLGKCVKYAKSSGQVYHYIHNAGQNRIAALVRLSDAHENGRSIAVHIACSNPVVLAIKPEDVSEADVEDEVRLLPLVKDDSKAKVRRQLSLLGSLYIMDSSMTIEQLLNGLSVIEFSRIKIGV